MMAEAAADSGCRRMAGYERGRLLGRGRHSHVYLATTADRSCPVALKVASRTGAHAVGTGRGFGAEFKVMKDLAHPNMIRGLDHGVCNGQAFLAMEYAEGGTLAQRADRPDLTEALTMLRQATAALAWLHQHDWVHGDVKPANLLLRADRSLALSDFGCIRRRGEPAQDQALVGTPRYAAPEQSECAAADPAADVYSLGACLYEMLSGHPLYPGETLTELFCQHLLAPVPRLGSEYAALQPVLDAMLAKEPRHRLPDAQAVQQELRRIEHFC